MKKAGRAAVPGITQTAVIFVINGKDADYDKNRLIYHV